MGDEESKKPNDFVRIPQEGGVVGIPAGSSLQGVVAHLSEKTNFLTIVAYAIILALFIGFISVVFTLAGILTDAWRFNATSYIDYQTSVKDNNKKFEDVNSNIEKMRSDVSGLEESLSKMDKKLDTIKNNQSMPPTVVDQKDAR
ncbi:hypothetical protein HY633_03880 [Candidatus Uhrbacteria bacterium]|nr:hypothetical protein [Candidatus Uhrbacteria bacterium]